MSEADESLCLKLDTGMVDSYPKPIMLSGESCRLLGVAEPPDSETLNERPATSDELGGKVSSGPTELTEMVFAEHGHGDATDESLG